MRSASTGGVRASSAGLIYDLRMDADMQHEPLDHEQALLAVEMFRMLADPTRVQLLWLLIDSERAVNELAALVGKSGPAVSQHLAKLRLGRLVQTRREGTSVRYRLANEHIARLVTDAVHNAEHASSEEPAHHRVAPTAGDARAGGLRPLRGVR